MRLTRQYGASTRTIALALLFLLLAFSSAQAAHFHAEGGPEAHCDLCLLAHHAVVPALQVVLVAGNLTATTLPVSEAQPLCSREALTTRIRPPPASV